MAHPSTARLQALPPAERTVGQLVAESIRFYQDHFWAVLPLGLALAVIDQAEAGRTPLQQAVILLAGGPLLTAAYVRASSLVSGAPWSRRAFLAGLLVYIPFPVLKLAFVMPGLAWLAFMGLAVPAAVVERLGVREALVRGRRLGTADYVHALGSIATLVIVYALTSEILWLLLRGQADAALRASLFLADLALSPLLLVGAALLYFDQRTRLPSTVPT